MNPECPRLENPDNFRKAKAVLEAHKIVMWEYDICSDSIHLADNYFEVLGLDAAGIHFTTIDEAYRFVHPESRKIFNPAVFRERLRQRNDMPSLRIRMLGRNGQTIWLEENFFSVLEQDGQGRPRRLMFYTENITEQCEREAEIRRLQERTRKVIEAMPEFIFIFDDNFFIRDVLKSEGTSLLHSVNELIGSDGRKFYSPDVSDLFLRNIRACLADGKLREIEYPLDVEGKGRFYFQARITPFEGNTALALIHDIGDRMLREAELLGAKRKAEESDRMKSLFLANMSHEIRTPLNAIIGFSEIIGSTEELEEKEEYARIIRKNSDLLLQLIDDVLDLSRIESGKSEMNLQPTELSGLLEEIGKVHRLKMVNGVAFRLEYPEKIIWTHTDRNRVMQVLFNFLSNAIKNTGKGSITLGMDEDEQWLKLYVSDTGSGIPEERISQIFNRFEKLDEFKPGTGLGLSICQTIADCLGGRIEVESVLGEGSKFTLLIPRNSVKPEHRTNNNDWRVVVPENRS